jgi:hypothetical protein
MVQIHSPRPISFFPLFYLHIHFASVRYGISGARSQIRAAPHVRGTYARTKLPPAVFCDSQTQSVARCSCQEIDSLEDRFYRNNCGRGGRVRTNWCLPRSAPSKFFCVGSIWLECMMSVAQHSVALFLREEMLRIFVCGCSSKRS